MRRMLAALGLFALVGSALAPSAVLAQEDVTQASGHAEEGGEHGGHGKQIEPGIGDEGHLRGRRDRADRTL